MPGSKCIYKPNINSPIENVQDLFGFYYCKIITNKQYIGLLPYRTKNGIIMPECSWEGWYFSEELKFAQEHGYKITIIRGYSFDKVYNVFDSYVNDLYETKSNTSDKVVRAVTKSLLNNLLGRFGLDMHKSRTEIMSADKFNEISQSKLVLDVDILGDYFIVNYLNHVNKDICDTIDVDYKNVVINNLKTRQESEETFNNVSIAIASAVNSYARIHISRIKLDILNKGNCIYYSDTDSIVTYKPLDISLIGKELGLLKLEHKIKEGIFISNKTYCLYDNNAVFINRAKGVISSSLTYEYYRSLLKNKTVNTAIKKSSNINWSGGYVSIKTANDIKINYNSYTKRTKVYDSENKWVNSRPNIKTYHTNNLKNIKKNIMYKMFLVI